MTDAVWEGWWVVRWGQRLVHIEADDAADAVQALHRRATGDGGLAGGPGGAQRPRVRRAPRSTAGAGDFTRAVIDRHRWASSPRRNA